MSTRGRGSSYCARFHEGVTRCAVALVCAAWAWMGQAPALTGSGDSATGPLETVSPRLNSVTALTESSLSVLFSEPMLSPGAAGNYAVSGLGVGTLNVNPDGVTGGGPYTLSWFSGEMQDGVAVTVTAVGLQDLVGNPINPAQNSASGTGIGISPVFTNLLATPARAGAGETALITFTASEPLAGDPSVKVNGRDAQWVSGAKAVDFGFEYEVQSGDPLGMAVISVMGVDPAGNAGSLTDSAALEIVEEPFGLPLYAWPAGLALALAGIVVFARRRTSSAAGGARGGFLLLLFALLASAAAFAQGPAVSNVAFTQRDNGAGGTEVLITYDLIAPNGPCDITVSLSKDGGTDGFSHPVTSVTGALTGVTTGTSHAITWDIRADYPEEDIPNAQIHVTADDGVAPPEVTSFEINTGAATTTDPDVTLDNTASNSPTEYMASEASDFSGATWQPYGTAPTFTLSSGEGGTKTVYFKVRNAAGESAPVSDTIDFTEHTVLLPGDVPLTVVWVPSGSFDMGRYPGEQSSYSWEDPQHSVTVSGFWMAKYELTKAQWTAVMSTTPWNGQSYVLNDPNSPAVYVSWNDAQSFITALNGLTGLTFRLPSEAEWEYACRAGTTTRFYWGDDPSYTAGNAYCWWRYNAWDVGEGYAHIVGLKTENAFGLYDMSGNVWEWCEDDWHSNYTGAPADGSAWVDSPRGSNRVQRGGSWDLFGHNCRSAYRHDAGGPSGSFFSIGFRLAADNRPIVISFVINNDYVSTDSRAVTLNNTATNGPAEYMASESATFTGATWQPYDAAPAFTLSSGEGGTKTVYFKVRNAAGESAVVSDTINLVEERTILLPGDVPLTMVWIPSGSFLMGRYPGEADSESREDPQHPVTLGYGFWMGKYEVTQQQWIAVRGSWPGTAPYAARGQGNTYPAYFVSWTAAKNFITSLNAHISSSGQGPLTVRLPSEAEWEYACRAGTQTRFYWGDDSGYTQIGTYAWYIGNNSPVGTKPVGGKTANAFGLYDMSGNVWEWCEDDYHGSYTGAPADGSAWIDSPRASGRGIRSGRWDHYAWICRSAYRTGGAPGDRYDTIGFRLAADQ